MKYVLTGGPGVGKTTILNILKEQGYTVLTEKARSIIEIEQQKNSNILPWKDLFLFQQRVVEKQLADEENYNNQDVFCDRSIIDGYAYCKLGKVEIPENVIKNGFKRYDLVFLLDPLLDYQNDESRKENLETAKEIHLAIEQTYRYFGYEPIKIPVDTPENRVKIILDIVSNSSKKT